jgi:glycosyltransferase involved in cell wall biosynthesis
MKEYDRQVMPTLYRRASMCVVPSRRESFGQTVIESFVFRTPVIVANTTALGEIVRHGRTGLKFTDGEYEELADCMNSLLDDPALASRLASAATADLESRFTRDIMTQAYIDLYTRLIGRRRPLRREP